MFVAMRSLLSTNSFITAIDRARLDGVLKQKSMSFASAAAAESSNFAARKRLDFP